MIIDTVGNCEEVELSAAYADGLAWTIVYEVSDGVVEFADEGIFTTRSGAFVKMQEMRDSGQWTDLYVVSIKAFNPCGLNATE